MKLTPTMVFARACLAVVGWRAELEVPAEPKYVLIAAPHTSNWDGVLMLLCGAACGVQLAWVAKHTLFRPPLGWLLRATGGIPVDRRVQTHAVEHLAEIFRAYDKLALAVPPEGTRRRAPCWKSGFYYVAQTAGVPICLGYLDYGRKRGGLGPLLRPTGDVRADMDVIRAFYADKKGLYPESQGPIRLQQEGEP